MYKLRHTTGNDKRLVGHKYHVGMVDPEKAHIRWQDKGRMNLEVTWHDDVGNVKGPLHLRRGCYWCLFKRTITQTLLAQLL